jgi:hypothetical protein
MAGERELRPRREDPDPDVSAFARREQKHRLGEVHLQRQALHLLGCEGTTVDEDAELVAVQRLGGEDITDEVGMQLGCSVPVGEPRNQGCVVHHGEYTDRCVYSTEDHDNAARQEANQ